MESRIKIFIGSSVEGKKYAECIGRVLKEQGNIDPLLWWDPACFPPNSTAIESLENITARIDGAILVATPDDRIFKRGEEKFSPSVNVMLEYGFFLGFLGRVRVAIARVEHADLPSDLAGVTYIHLPQVEGSRIDTTYDRLTAAPNVVAWLEQLADTPDLGRRLSPHLQAIYERSKGNLRVIIPAFKVDADGDVDSPSTEGSMVTMMTSVEGMAYGWLLKAFSPVMKGGQKIECLTAYQGQTFAQGVATFLIGAPSTNENTRQIFSRWYQSDMATQAAANYGDIIIYQGEEFKTKFSHGLATRDFSFLIYRPQFELYVCAGTSPFGTAGAVSMLTEPQEGQGVQVIPEYIKSRKPFVAVGEVEIYSETYWMFKRILRISLETGEDGALE